MANTVFIDIRKQKNITGNVWTLGKAFLATRKSSPHTWRHVCGSKAGLMKARKSSGRSSRIGMTKQTSGCTTLFPILELNSDKI
jgi:hypothetical protein